MKKIGFIINPVAGLGGSVGLKGSDSEEIIECALKMGAIPRANERAAVTLKELLPYKDNFELIVAPGKMGEETALECGFSPILTNIVAKGEFGTTTPEDTVSAAKEMVCRGVDIILFAGGDGTARNIYQAVGDKQTVIGIPAGVKIHSAVYAVNPQNAGALAVDIVCSRVFQMTSGEVMDIDEEAFRSGIVSARLYGYMQIPLSSVHLQGGKLSSRGSNMFDIEGIAASVADDMEEGILYIIGPGSTTAAVMDELKLPYTLLGVDAVYNKRLIDRDLSEVRLLSLLDKYESAKIVVTPIGGQACLFGRGNQQISPSVIRRVGKKNIIVIATKTKLQSFYGQKMLVDTGDEHLNRELCGYIRVITAYHEQSVIPIGM